MYAQNILELRNMPEREEVLPKLIGEPPGTIRDILTVIIQQGSNIAVLHEQVVNLKKDTEVLRSASHLHGSELQKIVLLEDRCASALERIEVAHTAIQTDVKSLMKREHEFKGAWWTLLRVGAFLCALAAVAAWALEHHITIGIH